MMPPNIIPDAIRLDLDYGLSAEHIAAWTGERVETLVHQLTTNGCPDLSVRLARRYTTKT